MTERNGGISLALGTFDGFHTGHMAVINAAKKSEYPTYALLFDEHPLKAITGKAPAELLCEHVLMRIREEYGIRAIHICFEDIMGLSARDFFTEYLIDDFAVKELSCGSNYTFGAGGSGDVSLLKKLCDEYGVKLNVVPTVTYNGEPVSSTRIRKAIESGNVEDANAMLGRPFSYCFEVINGDERGRGLGYPTANQILPDGFVQLRRGVYASECLIDGRIYPAVTNYGVRPTLDGTRCVSETHIIGFEGNLYKRYIEVWLFSFIRDEMKFNDAHELSQAIAGDVETSLQIFSRHLENGN